MEESMQSWFGLKDEHTDFTIETDADADQFFARQDLDDRLHRLLRRSFRTGSPPKLVLYGDWGVGKTHTMRHIEYVIAHNDAFRATVVFVEMPDITARSTFQVAHAAFLDALGFERAKAWILAFYTQHPADAPALIQDYVQSGDIASAFTNLLVPGEGGRIAWDWLRGLPLSAADAKMAGLPSILAQSNQFVHVLRLLGRFSKEVDDRILVFMLDEATKLGSVSNQAAVDHWINALKLLADQQTKEVGLIVSGSWIDPNDMAIPLQDQQVMTRFGEHNYEQLHNLDETDAAEFVGRLLSEWLDPVRRDALIEQYGVQADGEDLSAATFPFTRQGAELTVQYACRRGGYTTPRDLQSTLDDLLNRAIDDDRHIASARYLNSLIAG